MRNTRLPSWMAHSRRIPAIIRSAINRILSSRSSGWAKISESGARSYYLDACPTDASHFLRTARRFGWGSEPPVVPEPAPKKKRGFFSRLFGADKKQQEAPQETVALADGGFLLPQRPLLQLRAPLASILLASLRRDGGRVGW